MTKGINKAEFSKAISLIFESDEVKRRPCVFLSHKRVDKPKCREIAAYLSAAGIHYYLDEEDSLLQQVDADNDAFAVTEAIKKGISNSTHMLVVVSEVTFTSSWIPFEIGFGHAKILGDATDKRSIKLGVLTLREISERPLPDFMQVAYPIRGTLSLNDYIARIAGEDRQQMINEQRLTSQNKTNHPLDAVLNWKL